MIRRKSDLAVLRKAVPCKEAKHCEQVRLPGREIVVDQDFRAIAEVLRNVIVLLQVNAQGLQIVTWAGAIHNVVPDEESRGISIERNQQFADLLRASKRVIFDPLHLGGIRKAQCEI